MSNAGRPPTVHRDAVRQMLDVLWIEGNHNPTYSVCLNKVDISEQYFNRIKLDWRRERGLIGKARGIRRDIAKYDKEEVAAAVAEVRSAGFRLPTAETKLASGRPIEPTEELTVSQRAIREYNVASRRVGLSRARAK